MRTPPEKVGHADRDAVDFRKGCYLGQELTVRTYHTGATRKRILPISLFPLAPSLLEMPLEEAITAPHRTPSPISGQMIGGDIIYHPPPDAASQKPRPAGKILSLHPTANQVGLGLVRLEYTERVWGLFGLASSPSTSEAKTNTVSLRSWKQGGRLSTTLDGEEWGVYVATGEAYSAAMESLGAEAEGKEA